jgi:hypothetical protein
MWVWTLVLSKSSSSSYTWSTKKVTHIFSFFLKAIMVLIVLSYTSLFEFMFALFMLVFCSKMICVHFFSSFDPFHGHVYVITSLKVFLMVLIYAKFQKFASFSRSSKIITCILGIQTSTIQLQVVSLHSSSFCNLASFLFFSLNINLKIYYDPRVWHNPWLISKVSKNIVAVVRLISKSWPPKLKATSLYSNLSSRPLHVWTLPCYFWFFKFVLSFLSYVFHLCVCFLLWVQRVEFKVIKVMVFIFTFLHVLAFVF